MKIFSIVSVLLFCLCSCEPDCGCPYRKSSCSIKIHTEECQKNKQEFIKKYHEHEF